MKVKFNLFLLFSLIVASSMLNACGIESGQLTALQPSPRLTSFTSTIAISTSTATPDMIVELPSEAPFPTKIIISNNGPTESRLGDLINDTSVIFPESLTTGYSDENFSFDFRLSNSLVRNSGIKKFQLPYDMAKRMAYQTLGQIMYMLRNTDSRYSGFKEIENMLNSGTFPIGTTIFQDKAIEAIGELPIKIDYAYVELSGEFNKIEFNSVTMNEFSEIVNGLQSEGITFACRPDRQFTGCTTKDGGTDALSFITKEGKLIIISYNRGNSNSEKFDSYQPPMEYQHLENNDFNYFGSIIQGFEKGLVWIQQELLKGGGTVITYNSVNNICPLPKDGQYLNGEGGSCQAAVDEAFSP